MALLLGRYVTRFSKQLPVTASVVFLSTEKPPSATKKTKKPPEIRINLIDNNTLTVISMDSAKKLANHKGFKLTLIEDAAHWMRVGNRQVFQLLHPGSKVASNKETNMRDQGFKGLKKMVFSVGIHEHDIETKIRKIEKWVAGGYVVDIAIDMSDKTHVSSPTHLSV